MKNSPRYIYVASSWRNQRQPEVCSALRADGIEHYDFRNPPGGTGFSWKEVKPNDGPSIDAWCLNCGTPIFQTTYRNAPGATPGPDFDPGDDRVAWRHHGGWAVCPRGEASGWNAYPSDMKPKGSDWETAADYLAMVEHPRAIEGFRSDFEAMQRADTFVLVLPCGKSAHLELGWAVGAGKRTAILLEDPVEPELMYRMVDFMSPLLGELLQWIES